MAASLCLIAVGRLGRGVEADLAAQYRARLPFALDIHEIDDRRRPAQDGKAWEAARILEQVPAGAYLIALDERGASLSSPDFAALVGRLRDEARPLALVIGGADGLDEAIRGRADQLVAFGRATWPHKLVRAMLLEQLYRASTILTGHPYHRA